MNNDVKKILISEEQIVERCKELGKQISKDYDGKRPICIGLLKGSVPFLVELTKNITIDIEIDYMDVSSYNGTESGDVRIIKDLESSISNREILIVEDIIDTGKTYDKVKKILMARGPKNIKIVTMLEKKEHRVVPVQLDYVGFEIPDEFVIGFGLDYNQKYRNLPYVGVISESAID